MSAQVGLVTPNPIAQTNTPGQRLRLRGGVGGGPAPGARAGAGAGARRAGRRGVRRGAQRGAGRGGGRRSGRAAQSPPGPVPFHVSRPRRVAAA